MRISKRDELRKRIIDTAREKFARNGFKNVKTDELAVEIGISKRTLYNTFPSKEKLFEEVILSEFERLSNDIDEIFERIFNDKNINFIEELKNIWNVTAYTSIFYTKEFFVDIKKYFPDIWDKVVDFRRNKMKEHFFKITEVGAKAGVFKPNLKYDLIYMIHRSIIDNIMTPEVLLELPYTPKEAMETIYELLLTGSLSDEFRADYCKGVHGLTCKIANNIQ